MKKVCCLITLLTILISGCGESIHKSGDSLDTFTNVWFRNRENLNREIPAYQDVGTLLIAENYVEFIGDKFNITMKTITNTSFGKQGKDTYNNWVILSYEDENGIPQKVYFKDGGMLGHGRKTEKMYELVKRLSNE